MGYTHRYYLLQDIQGCRGWHHSQAKRNGLRESRVGLRSFLPFVTGIRMAKLPITLLCGVGMFDIRSLTCGPNMIASSFWKAWEMPTI